MKDGTALSLIQSGSSSKRLNHLWIASCSSPPSRRSPACAFLSRNDGLLLVALIVTLLFIGLFSLKSPPPATVTCQFLQGPRAGQYGIGFADRLGTRLGGECGDGQGSTGIITGLPLIAPEPSIAIPVLLIVMVILVMALVGRLSMRFRRSEASAIADRAVAYFLQLNDMA